MMDRTYVRVQFILGSKFGFGPGFFMQSTFNCSQFQQFTFVGFTSDVLEIEVKDRFARSRPSISRFLGKRKIQLSSLMQEKDLR